MRNFVGLTRPAKIFGFRMPQQVDVSLYFPRLFDILSSAAGENPKQNKQCECGTCSLRREYRQELSDETFRGAECSEQPMHKDRSSRMATRNNSSPYILPKRTPNSARPGTFITTRNLSTLHIQPRPTPFLGETIAKSSTQPLRVVGRIIEPMNLGSSRQIFLAPTSAVLSPTEHQLSNVQPMIHDNFHRSPSSQQRAPMFKSNNDQSEEDEFDLGEVYRLLDESAGFRAQELGIPRRRERLINLTPEEKMNRRKHKNRIAAQAARDRKKVNTHRLEDSLRRALLEIGRLRGEMNLLRADNARLEADNQTLRFGQERSGSSDSVIDTATFRLHSKDEPMHYDEKHLPSQRKCQRQFRPQPILNHQQNIDVKPSFLVRSTEKTREQVQPQQRNGGFGQQDSVGSAASFHEPLQRERESSRASRSSGSGRPKWTEKKASAMACAHGAVAGGEDVELQKIFDELFEDFDFPVDVDRFCNEVIEEGIVESSDAFGAVEVNATQQQQTNCSNGCVSSTDAAKSQAQSSAQVPLIEHQGKLWQQCRVGGGQQQQHGLGSGGAVAAALSPYNYFIQPAPTAAPLSVCSSFVSTSNSEPNPSSNNGSSPSYQKVSSPCLSSHSTYIDEFTSTFDDDQHQFVPFRRAESKRDPFLSSIKQEYLDHFDDHPPAYDLEPIDWTMSNGFESLGAEESCTLEEVSTMSEDPNEEDGQQDLLNVNWPISSYTSPPPSHFSSNHSSFLSYC